MNALNIIKRAYFAVMYNTTSLVNVMLTLGVITPFVVLATISDTLTIPGAVSAFGITILATYCYNLVYIVNDYLDHDKDMLLGTPKLTARHLLGRPWLAIVVSIFATVIATASLIYPQLALPLVSYCLMLAGLSCIHSRYQSAKLFTIFMERLAKFTMPLVFIAIVTGRTDVKAMLVAALIVFPFSHTFDYAYRGYIRDRLTQSVNVRFAVYAVYYAALTAELYAYYGFGQLAANSSTIISYVGLYLLISAICDLLAPRLPLRALDSAYSTVVAGEKRRLVTYGLIQLALLILGGFYELPN